MRLGKMYISQCLVSKDRIENLLNSAHTRRSSPIREREKDIVAQKNKLNQIITSRRLYTINLQHPAVEPEESHLSYCHKSSASVWKMFQRLLLLGLVGLFAFITASVAQPARSGSVASCPSNICSAKNDPHMVTFDGKRYENHVGEGEYVMYSHDTLPIRVHAYFCNCSRTSSIVCVCGFAVQSGRCKFALNHNESDDAIIAAGGNRGRNTLLIERLGKNKYHVTVPTGTKIEYSPGHLKIKASLEDYTHVNGLCGEFDGNCKNDLKLRDSNSSSSANGAAACSGSYPVYPRIYPNDFSRSWRILSAMKESLFFKNHGAIRPNMVSDLPLWIEEQEIFHCACIRTGSTQRGLFKDTVTVARTRQEDCVGKHDTADIWDENLPKSFSGRKKREVDTPVPTAASPDSEAEDVFYPNPVYKGSFTGEPPTVEVTEPIDMTWKNGWTEAKARTFCSQKYNENKAVSKCKSVVYKKLNVAANIEECVLDIQMSGTNASSDVQLHSMVDECKTHYETAPELWEEPVMVEAVKEVCQDDCSGHGECVEGVCKCNEGFVEPSCSPPPTPVDCTVSDWTTWSACSATCNNGTQGRTRSVVRKEMNGGSCVPLEEARQCASMQPVNCVVSPWNDYSSCSVSCGSGTQTRDRSVLINPNSCGEQCPTLSQSQTCNTPTVNCAVSIWTRWSSCSVSCGSGTQTRTRIIQTPANSCGVPCPVLSQSQTCNTPFVNCEVSSWTSWTTTGTSKSRTREIVTHPNSCGTPCPDLSETEQACDANHRCMVNPVYPWYTVGIGTYMDNCHECECICGHKKVSCHKVEDCTPDYYDDYYY